MRNTICDVNIGDHVVCYDNYLHDYDEHVLCIETIDKEQECISETNPEGIVLYGSDLTYGDDDELSINRIGEENFVRIALKYFEAENQKKSRLAHEIVELFEDLLTQKNIEIPCSDEEEENIRHDGGNEAKLYGMEYYDLVNKVQNLL